MSLIRIAAVLLCVYAAVGALVFVSQRSLLYYPTHRTVDSVMTPWKVAGQPWGMVRAGKTPSQVWLVTHGNGGQASHRDYLLEYLGADVAVYVLEYPGYGDRLGQPSEENINAAAAMAWQHLRATYPGVPMGVLGESIGSGPAAWLAGQVDPPDKTVLLVPFDQLHRVAADRFWWLPVKWLMRDNWDNVAALDGYDGQLEIYAARDDEVIPVERAQALAAAYPEARFEIMAGSHNSWQWEGRFDMVTASESASEPRN